MVLVYYGMGGASVLCSGALVVPVYYGMGGASSAGVRGECGSRFSAAAAAGQHTL